MSQSELLKASPLFKALGERELQSLLKKTPTERFEPGMKLISQGAPALKAYLLLEGRLLVAAQNAGNPLSIGMHKAPSLVGVIELFKELPSLADVLALESCTCLVFSRPALQEVLVRNHQVALNLIQILCQELHQTAKDLRVQLLGQVEHLLANTLRYYALVYGEPRQQGVLIRKELNKSELAEILGVARRSVQRGIAKLESEDVIRIEGAYLLIPDPLALDRKADGCWAERPEVIPMSHHFHI